MDSQAVLSKTAKGEEAIAHRSHGLERNLRYVLILVDGKSSVEEIRSKGAGLPDIEGGLQQLIDGGYIQHGSGTHAADSDFAAVKQRLIDIATEVLGPHADKVVRKLEGAPDTREGVVEAMNSCKKMVRLIIDEKKAEELAARCHQALD